MIRAIKNILKPLKIRLIMLQALLKREQNKKLRPNYKCTIDTKRCFGNSLSPNYRYEYFGENTPVCCATHLYNILRDVTKVLEDSGIEYFISFGTLLGAVRHKGLIPWDTDIDIIIPQRVKSDAIEVLQKHLPSNYVVLQDRDDNIVGSLVRVNLSKVNTLHIDLFTYIEKDETIVFGYKRRFDKNDIFPLRKMEFCDLSLYAPRDINRQLITFYGEDFMEYAYKQWALDKTKFKITSFEPAIIEE
jgi:phosphorylcholine metabolism protein LicD